MKRVMVNLDDEAGRLLEARAAAEKRSASSYIAVLVDRDLREAGLVPGDSNAQILAAAHEVGHKQALSVLERAARKKGGA